MISAGPSTAGDVRLHPRIEFKPVERDAAITNGNLRKLWPHVGIKAIAIHAEVRERISMADDPGEDLDWHV